MDKLEFNIQDKQNDNYQFKTVVIFVNGINIIEQLKKFEMPFAKKEGSENIAGGYDGLSPETLLKNLTNPNELDIDENGKVSILECECGCDGCWPMKTKVIHFENKVIWTEFEQPHRTIESNHFWDYSNFGHFSFNTNNYKEQLDKLRQIK